MRRELIPLIEEHKRLLVDVAREGPEKSQVLILDFIGRCVKASSDIPNLKDRVELSSILRYWGDVILNESGHYPDISLKEPHGRLTISGLGWEDWEANCRRLAGDFLRSKEEDSTYRPEWAISRKAGEEQLSKFLTSDNTAMVVTGRIGVGKTFLICHLASRESLDEHKLLVMPFDCNSIVSSLSALSREASTGLDASIGLHIARGLGFPDYPTFEAELGRIQEDLEERSSYLLICFDGIERFRMPIFPDQMIRQQPTMLGPRELLVSLNSFAINIAKSKATRVKFLLTCVSSTWSWLGVDRLLSSSIYFTPETKNQSFVLTEYSSEEFTAAYEKYRRAYGLPQGLIETGKVMKVTEHSPYLMRLAVDIMRRRGGTLPTESTLCQRYFHDKVLRGTQEEQVEKDNYLTKFARIADAAGRVASKDADVTSSAYNELVLDGLLVFQKLEEPYPHIALTLDPPKLTRFINQWYEHDRET